MSNGGNIVGGGYRISISPEYDTQSAEERRDAAWRRDPGLQRLTRPWGDVLTQGWGQAVYAWLKAQGDNADGTTKYNVFALGNGPDGSKIFEVPNREHYDVGRVHNDALYVQVTVAPDLEDLARQDAEKAQATTAAALLRKQQELADARAQADLFKADQEIAAARAAAGLGEQTIEVTVWGAQNENVFVALNSAESMSSDGPHPGVAIIGPGAWEAAYPGQTPQSFGLMKRVLAWPGSGNKGVAGSQEVNSLIQAARGNGLPGQVQAAQQALSYAKIPY